MIESSLYQYLSTQTSITDLVSTRIYPHHLPQSATYPVLTHQTISSVHDHVIDSAAGVVTARIQVDIWGTTLSSVLTIAEQVRLKLHGFSGTMISSTVHFIQLDNEQDLSEPPQDGSDNWLYRRSQDYLIKYAETVPSL